MGRAGGAERRPYSLAISPSDSRARGELELLVGLDPDGRPPSWLGPLEPRHRPRDRRAARDVRLPGGARGTALPVRRPAAPGIAPLRAMLHEALARPTTASASVLCSARTADDFAYAAELRALAAAGRITLWQTVTREVGAHWNGAKGRVALHHLRAMLHDEPTLCFLCGPHGLVREASLLLEEAGVSAETDTGGGLGRVG